MDERDRQRIIKELREFTDSLAWQHLCSSLDASALNAAYKLGDKPGDEAGNHFTRGAIWGLKTMKTLPYNLLQQLENERFLDDKRGKQ